MVPQAWCNSNTGIFKVLWKEVKSQTGRGRDRFRIADLLQANAVVRQYSNSWRQLMWDGRSEDVWEEGYSGSTEEKGETAETEEEMVEVEEDRGGVP